MYIPYVEPSNNAYYRMPRPSDPELDTWRSPPPLFLPPPPPSRHSGKESRSRMFSKACSLTVLTNGTSWGDTSVLCLCCPLGPTISSPHGCWASEVCLLGLKNWIFPPNTVVMNLDISLITWCKWAARGPDATAVKASSTLCTYALMHVHVHIYIYVQIYTIHICICVYVQIYIYLDIHICTYIQKCTYTHIHTHTHIYIYMQRGKGGVRKG